MKKVSVIICTYNGEKYLKEQIESIVNQTYPIHELLIKDDCSTDGTISIIKEYIQEYPYIRLIENKVREGVNRNFFSAMHLSTGEYIAISDQDDIWEPNKLELQINAIGDKLLCTGFSKPFSSEGISVAFDSRRPNLNLIRMLYVGMIPGHTMLIHKNLISYLPEKSALTYDHQLQIAAASMESIEFVDKVLVNQRRHPNAVTLSKPTDHNFSIKNILNKIKETVCYYIEIKPKMQKRFEIIEEFLKQMPCQNIELNDALKMAHLQTKNSFISWVKLTTLCIKKHDKLFHTRDKNKLRSVIRAAYFPIYSSYYFRYMSEHFKRY